MWLNIIRTGMRVPLTQGSPPQTLGSEVMRSFIFFLQKSLPQHYPTANNYLYSEQSEEFILGLGIHPSNKVCNIRFSPS